MSNKLCQINLYHDSHKQKITAKKNNFRTQNFLCK